MHGMTDQLDALLDLRRRLYRAIEAETAECDRGGVGFTPPLDIVSSPDGLIVTVELPGVAREDVEVELEGTTLKITGERKAGEQGRYFRRERPCGRFERSLALPAGKEWELAATLREGLLSISIKAASGEAQG